MHILPRMDAHQFFLKSVKLVASAYFEAAVLLGKDYNSVVRQNRFTNHLNSLRVEKQIRDNVDIAAAL